MLQQHQAYLEHLVTFQALDHSYQVLDRHYFLAAREQTFETADSLTPSPPAKKKKTTARQDQAEQG